MPSKTRSKPKSQSRIQILEAQLARARAQEKLNAKFAKLPAAAQRVVVAQDVLDQLDARSLFAKHSVYVERIDGVTSFEDDTPIISAISVPCHVCAKGAVFTSMVGITNGVTFGDVLEHDEEASLDEISSEEIKEYAGDVFPAAMLDLMEAIFENQDLEGPMRRYYGDERAEKLVPGLAEQTSVAKHGLRGADKRLRWVMENIVANKGELVLKKRDIDRVG